MNKLPTVANFEKVILDFPAIITANFMFSGCTIETHPVRQAHEFLNLVKRGTVTSLDGSSKRSFWEGDYLLVKDIVSYLNDGSIMKEQLEQLSSDERVIPFGSQNIFVHSYHLPFKS